MHTNDTSTLMLIHKISKVNIKLEVDIGIVQKSIQPYGKCTPLLQSRDIKIQNTRMHENVITGVMNIISIKTNQWIKCSCLLLTGYGNISGWSILCSLDNFMNTSFAYYEIILFGIKIVSKNKRVHSHLKFSIENLFFFNKRWQFMSSTLKTNIFLIKKTWVNCQKVEQT